MLVSAYKHKIRTQKQLVEICKFPDGSLGDKMFKHRVIYVAAALGQLLLSRL